MADAVLLLNITRPYYSSKRKRPLFKREGAVQHDAQLLLFNIQPHAGPVNPE
jgi:hypothetical protein